MLQDAYPYYLANEARSPNQDLVVHDKYSGAVATRVAMADVNAIDEAIGAAVTAAPAMAASIARWSCASVSLSMDAVGSSRMSSGGLR